jgi:DNA-binding HxlR family transcriptional regulator
MSKTTEFRGPCPITSSLDIFGDKWTLVIIKQMLFEQKSTFKDFTESQEAIATNILSARLKLLEAFDIVAKNTRPENKKTKIYTLTDKGLSFTPILIELILWSKNNIQDIHPGLNIHPAMQAAHFNKEIGQEQVITDYLKHKASLLN